MIPQFYREKMFDALVSSSSEANKWLIVVNGAAAIAVLPVGLKLIDMGLGQVLVVVVDGLILFAFGTGLGLVCYGLAYLTNFFGNYSIQLLGNTDPPTSHPFWEKSMFLARVGKIFDLSIMLVWLLGAGAFVFGVFQLAEAFDLAADMLESKE